MKAAISKMMVLQQWLGVPSIETELNRVFMTEIARGGLTFRGERVNCRRHDEVAGRENMESYQVFRTSLLKG